MRPHYAAAVMTLLFLACSDPGGREGGADSGTSVADAADAPSDRYEAMAPDAALPEGDLGLDAPSSDIYVGEVALAFDAVAVDSTGVIPDGLRLEAGDSGHLDQATADADAQSFVDMQCDGSAQSLLDLVASSVGKEHCGRATSSFWEGYIGVDGDGRVYHISSNGAPGNPVAPADPQAWIDSLATYRWHCLAGQTIYYGCNA